MQANQTQGIECIRKFLAAYDQHSTNGLRVGLADGFYGIDGGDEAETSYGHGATLYISQLRKVLESHDALVAVLKLSTDILASLDGKPYSFTGRIAENQKILKIATGAVL